VSSGDSAELSVALLMRNEAVAVHVLGAETPAAHLPEGAPLLDMVGTRLVAFEAIWELGFASLMLLS